MPHVMTMSELILLALELGGVAGFGCFFTFTACREFFAFLGGYLNTRSARLRQERVMAIKLANDRHQRVNAAALRSMSTEITPVGK